MNSLDRIDFQVSLPRKEIFKELTIKGFDGKGNLYLGIKRTN